MIGSYGCFLVFHQHSRRAHAKWGAQVPVLEKIIDLQGSSSDSTDVVLIGMLSKELKLRGSVSAGVENDEGCNRCSWLTNVVIDKKRRCWMTRHRKVEFRPRYGH